MAATGKKKSQLASLDVLISMRPLNYSGSKQKKKNKQISVVGKGNAADIW